jgi:AcrR family transcriptional regulator
MPPKKRIKLSPEQRHDQTKERLLDLAQYIAIEHGYDHFSLRELARQAGISAPSLYEYFPNKDAIIQAVGFRMSTALAASMFRAFKRAPDPKQRLLNMALAYVRTALRNPDTFRLLFNIVDPCSHIPQNSPPQSAYDMLRDAVSDLIGPASRNQDLLDSLSYGCWALIHGMAILQLTHLSNSNMNFPSADRLIISQFIDNLASFNKKLP